MFIFTKDDESHVHVGSIWICTNPGKGNTCIFLQIHMEFVAEDSKGATAFLRPIINLCACHNDGLCYQSMNNKNASEKSDKMNVLECECLNGYTGKFCESDLDACEANLNPCYPGVSCVDLPPPANISGYKCGPCPSGFTGDGSKCRGILHPAFRYHCG